MFGSKINQAPDPITYFAETNSRGQNIRFGIKDSDRTKHIYLIGKSGMGKSTTLENLAVQDIQNGNGLCFIDPHGSAVDTFLDYIPQERIDDVIYFAPFDFDHPVAFNVMENVDPSKRHLVAQGLLSSFKKIWGEDTFSDRMEHIVNNTLLALLEYPESTMLSIPRMFVDTKFQKKVIAKITDPVVKAFWTQEYASWSDTYRRDAYSAVLNKIGQFTSNPLIRNIVGQPKSSFDIRDVMDNRKILLVNLSIGQVGESNANLLGSMLTTKVFLAGMSRADLTKAELARTPQFYLYIDEFQNLANDSFADILAQARKYKLNLTLAHQYIEQMPETVRAAVFGNVGTLISFRVGATDAEVLSREFAEVFTVDDMVSLGIGQIYLSLMIDGVGSRPFSASTLLPLAKPAVSFREEVIDASRKFYSRPRETVETEITNWMNEGKSRTNTQGVSHESAKSQTNKGASSNGGEKTNSKKHREPVITAEMKQELPGKASFAEALRDALTRDNESTTNQGVLQEEKDEKKIEEPKEEKNKETDTADSNPTSTDNQDVQREPDHSHGRGKNRKRNNKRKKSTVKDNKEEKKEGGLTDFIKQVTN